MTLACMDNLWTCSSYEDLWHILECIWECDHMYGVGTIIDMEIENISCGHDHLGDTLI